MANKPSLKKKILRIGGWQAAKRIVKMVPIGGTLLAAGLIGYDIKKKGVLRGTVNSGLDMIPVFGIAKNAIELFTGDLIPDKIEKRSN
ncbi:MAG: hypothetical protein ACJ72Z_13380 [Pyrinomonadaceae bacterium]